MTTKSQISKIVLPTDSKLLNDEFIFGAATAAFQVEGGRASRTENIWDRFCQHEGKIDDASNGDVACNHFELWADDIKLMQKLGLDAYRLSISWTRVLNDDASLNSDGIDFYCRLLDGLNEAGIKPFVTLYHWDLPQVLEDKGGWLNRDTAFRFEDYVAKVTQALQGRVHSYATLNEPYCSAHLGYEIGLHAPGLVGKEYGKKAAHHLLLAHGLGMRVLQETSPDTINGLVVNVSPTYPASDSPADTRATNVAEQLINDWYIQPVLEAEYPSLLRDIPEAHRPDIVDGDMQIIATPMDFLGLNYYTRTIIKHSPDDDYAVYTPTDVQLTEMGWEVYSKGYKDILTRLNERYNLPPLYMTENGAAMVDVVEAGSVHDHERLEYFQKHLLAVDEAMRLGVDVRGYFAWSLMDNFEWFNGYTKRFGIVYVDYENQQRIIKNSGLAYSDLIRARKKQPQEAN